MSSIDTLKLSC